MAFSIQEEMIDNLRLKEKKKRILKKKQKIFASK